MDVCGYPEPAGSSRVFPRISERADSDLTACWPCHPTDPELHLLGCRHIHAYHIFQNTSLYFEWVFVSWSVAVLHHPGHDTLHKIKSFRDPRSSCYMIWTIQIWLKIDIGMTSVSIWSQFVPPPLPSPKSVTSHRHTYYGVSVYTCTQIYFPKVASQYPANKVLDLFCPPARLWVYFEFCLLIKSLCLQSHI